MKGRGYVGACEARQETVSEEYLDTDRQPEKGWELRKAKGKDCIRDGKGEGAGPCCGAVWRCSVVLFDAVL